MAKLYFRYGAMNCGKTANLLQTAFNYEECGQKVCVFKPGIDTKNQTKLLSRIGLERPTDFVCSSNDNVYEIIENDYANVACVLVDEAQFLDPAQVDQLALVATELNVPVICYGLRTNFRQTDGGFEGATRLLQIAQELTELKTICRCGKKATRTTRFLDGQLVTDGPDILIDNGKTKIEYRALCHKCYLEHLAKTNRHDS